MNRIHVKRLFQRLNKENRTWADWIFRIVVVCGLVFIIEALWPDVIPFDLYDPMFWVARGELVDWLLAALGLFAWGIGTNVVSRLLSRRQTSLERLLAKRLGGRLSAGAILQEGFLVSLRAGVTEEVYYRWCRWLLGIAGSLVLLYIWIGLMWFFVGIAVILLLVGERAHKIAGLALGLFAGVCLVFGLDYQFLYEAIAGPLANWMTLGFLEGYLFHPYSWTVGAGILMSNATYQDGHKYQGLFGRINSWFLGMFFFWMVVTYGLISAVVVHFLYDFLIFSTVAVFAAFRR